MTDWLGWQDILWIARGELAIVTGWTVVFLVYHLFKVGRLRHVTLRSWRRLPQAMQLAVAFLTVAVATFFLSMGGETVIILMARGLSAFGFLCALRIITRPMRWQWPWLGAIVTGLLFLIGALSHMA